MCQLTIAKLNDPLLNIKYLILQTQVNSMIDHQDGCGFYSTKGHYKYAAAASNLVNLGSDLRKISDPGVMFGHVRKATWTNNVKAVNNNNSHPFVNDKLALCHNGTLEFRTADKMKDEKYKDMIDSEIFFTRLTELFIENGCVDLPTVLQNTYREFYGKFAFLLHDRINDIFYCARGCTALLHFFPFSGGVNGYAINTEKLSFERSLMLFSGQTSSVGKGFDLLKTDPSLLTANTIFKLNEYDVEDVGELKEEKRPIPASVAQPKTYSNGESDATKNKGTRDSQQILAFMEKFKVSIQYVDLLMVIIYGKGLAQADWQIIDHFIKFFIPYANTLYTANVTKEWEKLRKTTSGLDYTFHARYGISFPYFFDKDVTHLRDLRKRIAVDESYD
jgi:predicted glutamine amidotransferase